MKTIATLLTTLTLSLLTTFAQEGYQLVWSDQFDGNTLNHDHWNYEQGGNGWGNNELQYYTDRTQNVRIENGYLIIEARKEGYPTAAPTRNYTSARITTKNKVKTCYGKIEARISLPAGAGTWPAFWMMPNDSYYGNWPRSGEIDIMEHVGADPTMISFATHTYYRNGTNGQNLHSKIYEDGVENQFHLYGVEWLNDRIRFTFDGQVRATFFRNFTEDWRGWPFDKDFFIIFNLALGGTMGGVVNNDIFNSSVQMKVDYVNVYRANITPIASHPSNNIFAYPNPCTDKLTINTSSPCRAELFDSMGYLVSHTTLQTGQTMPVTHLPKGIYLLKVHQNETITTQRIIKN
ncbi:family 16 glycosylhydrolase [Breznakibacter xylanolyticus]|nr:family 16 glycosylhydrolase [Breznakibacter xylanolyticus]